MIKKLISFIVSTNVNRQENQGKHIKQLYSPNCINMRGKKWIKRILSWMLFLIVPYIILSGINDSGRDRTSRELCPQVKYIHDMENYESLGKVLNVIWRTPNNYHLMKQFVTTENKDSILRFYGDELHREGWEYRGCVNNFNYSTNALNSITYRWEKTEYCFKITFMVANEIHMKQTDDGKLIYYINVLPQKQRVSL